jgi:dTDP-4-dehydrorhamnose 3,5-epimerase-like enzyme
MKLQVYPLSLPGVMLIRSARTSDARGFFAETYAKKDFAARFCDGCFSKARAPMPQGEFWY